MDGQSRVQAAARRGRPREFDAEEVLTAAQRLFWTQGVEQTSLAQLERATGLHKPSIYAAYGDKNALFLLTLERYRAHTSTLIAAALAKAELRDVVATFLRADLDLFCPHQRGCYLITIAAPAALYDERIKTITRDAADALDRALLQRIEQAPRRQVPHGMSSELVANLLTATHTALAVQSRAGTPATELRERVERFIALFPPHSTHASH